MNDQSEILRSSFLDRSPCPYFEDSRTCTIEYRIAGPEEMKNFHTYLSGGYRRLGRVFYRNVCEDCTACLPLRVKIDAFQISRSQKRTARKNRDIHVELSSSPSLSLEKITLYDKYIGSKHPLNRDNESTDPANILLSMHYGYARTIEMCYYLGSRLIGVGIVDEGKDALSSNYFYYDTDYLDRRLGIFSFLQELELARSLRKQYLYIGFYIEENPKMSYKKFFRPNQMLLSGRWREFVK